MIELFSFIVQAFDIAYNSTLTLVILTFYHARGIDHGYTYSRLIPVISVLLTKNWKITLKSLFLQKKSYISNFLSTSLII